MRMSGLGWASKEAGAHGGVAVAHRLAERPDHAVKSA